MAEGFGLSELGVVRLLRFSYGGFLLPVVVAAIHPDLVHGIVNSAGATLATLGAFVVGGAIYVVHRHVIGELFLYPGLHLVTKLWDKIHGRSGLDSTDTVAYLHALGVTRGEGRAAYNAVRRQFFEEKVRERLDIAHSEIHMLWITVDVTGVVAVYTSFAAIPSLVWFVIAGVFLVSATIADVRQHQQEAGMLRNSKEKEHTILSFLKQYGYIRNDIAANANR